MAAWITIYRSLPTQSVTWILTPSTPHEEWSSQVSIQQTLEHHLHTRQPAEGRTPPL